MSRHSACHERPKTDFSVEYSASISACLICHEPAQIRKPSWKCDCTHIACHETCMRKGWKYERQDKDLKEQCPQCRKCVPSDYILRIWAIKTALRVIDKDMVVADPSMVQFARRPSTKLHLVEHWGTTRETHRTVDCRRLGMGQAVRDFFGDDVPVVLEFYSPLRNTVIYNSETTTHVGGLEAHIDAYLFNFGVTERELHRVVDRLSQHSVTFTDPLTGKTEYAHDRLAFSWWTYRLLTRDT